MKKIEIITFVHAHNYGAMLQAYALQNILNRNQYDVKFLNYHDMEIEKNYKVIRINATSLKAIIKSILKNIVYFIYNLQRYRNCKKFEDRYLEFDNKEYYNIGALKNFNDSEILIAGSDQIWNSHITKGLSDIYTLNFGNEVIKKISYAASSGNTEIIKQNMQEYKEKLSKLDYISVREEELNNVLQDILKRRVVTVLDPTLLFTKNDWNNAIIENKIIKEKYILAYVVQPDKEYIKIVNNLSEKTDLKVIHFGLKNPGYKNVLKSAYTEGPLEFVNYIKNAEYVVATSFHATAFSIIFNKKFFIVPHRKTGARVTNLLEKLGIEGRTFETLEEFKNIDYKIETDWEKVEKKLEKERQKSINWLKNAIEG